MINFDIRELQKIEYKMLKDVTDMCDANGIIYFLSDGTLLGAARHQGFIPWDDDIDICMDVKNYRKFLRIAPKKLPNKYFVQNYKTDHKVGVKWTKVRINGTTSMERAMTNYDIHYGICMDIFVYTGMAQSKIGRWLQHCASIWMNNFLEKYAIQVAKIEVPAKLQLLYMLIPDALRLK